MAATITRRYSVTSSGGCVLTKIQGGDNLTRRKGDFMGEVDKDGIGEWYPKCKVRKEGNVYIATPHTTNPAKRTKREEEKIAVTVKDGKYVLEKPQDKPLDESNTVDGQVVEQADKSPPEPKEQHTGEVQELTRKQIFNNLFNKYSNLLPHIRKQTILQDMLPLFETKEDAEYFVWEQWRRKRRNIYVRRKRFEYKAYNQTYEFFFTITYDDKKHTEQSFEKSLKLAFSNLHKRYECLFQGVWERGTETERLHFHGLIYDPNRKILDGLETVSDYNLKTGKRKTYLQSRYFADKFGRNEFSKIIPQMYESAIKYITKYLSKGVKPYYSKGLYRFIESDIDGRDVLCKMDGEDEQDIRLIVSDKFTIWQEAVMIGEASPETIAQAPKLP